MHIPAFAAGALTAIGLSPGWIFIVENKIVGRATVGGDGAHWAAVARDEVYGVCYDGCNDCLAVEDIENACVQTSEAVLSGIDCDATKMWTWPEDDRYPSECLDAIGELRRRDEIRQKQFWLRFLHILVLVPLFAGYCVYRVLILASDSFDSWLQAQRRRMAATPRRRNSQANATTPLLRGATAAAVVVALVVMQAAPAAAWACKDIHPVHNQPFVSRTDETLMGNIHGWLSDCYEETYSCGESCRPEGSTTTCKPDDCSRLRAGASPSDFVRHAAKKVAACGFRMLDTVPGISSVRVANPRIEGSLWVKITVNRVNGSDGMDDQVRCLYEMVKWPRQAHLQRSPPNRWGVVGDMAGWVTGAVLRP